MFCGGVDPLYRGMVDALDQLEYQVKELGASSIKFYNGHVTGSWRCDDEKVAYPLYEKCRQLGIKVLQSHKGIPFGNQKLEDLSHVVREIGDRAVVDEREDARRRADSVLESRGIRDRIDGGDHGINAQRRLQERVGG